MSHDAAPTAVPRQSLDDAHLRRAFERSRAGGSDRSGLVREIAAELLDRLAAVRIQPRRVVELGCAEGRLTLDLARLYRNAEVIGIDHAPGLLAPLGRRRLFGPRPRPVAADIRRLPLADASVDLLVSNLALPWLEQLPDIFREWRRVLQPDGVLMFSTFGPDTLTELRTAWAAVDGYPHVNVFADMHDIGDALLGAGLRDPVMDVDRVERAYAGVAELLQSVRAIGGTNAHHGRRRGLLGRGDWQRLLAAYPAPTDAGGCLASWEVVYGHAWGAPLARGGQGDAREFRLSPDSIGRRHAGPRDRSRR